MCLGCQKGALTALCGGKHGDEVIVKNPPKYFKARSKPKTKCDTK